MLPELFLHIGTTKTGSTSIQFVLDGRRRELAAQGAYWPVTHGGAKRHLLLAAANASAGKFVQWVPEPVWQGMEPGARMAAYREEFAREIAGLPKKIDRVILSAEQFSLLLRKPADIQQLHGMLALLFSKMTVVIYLRRQDSHYGSMYAQSLRMGNLHMPDIAAVKVGYNQDYDYADLLARWADVFGRDNMLPRLFERTGAARFDVVDDFLAICRVKLDMSPDDEKRARNPSMNLVGQSVLMKVGEVLHRRSGSRSLDGFQWNKVAEAVTLACPGQGWQPTQEEARAFLARFEESNEAVRARWFPERQSLFALDLAKLPVTHEDADPNAALEGACAALVQALELGAARERAMSQQIAKLAEATGDSKRTIAALNHVLRTDGGNIAVRVQIAEQHIKSGDLNAAAATYKGARRIAPEDPLLAPLAEKLSALGVSIPAMEAVQAPTQAKRRKKMVDQSAIQ